MSQKDRLSSTETPGAHPLRLRVFAGPNGSGKTTVINSIRNLIVNDQPIDFGHYINADDIAVQLKKRNI